MFAFIKARDNLVSIPYFYSELVNSNTIALIVKLSKFTRKALVINLQFQGDDLLTPWKQINCIVK